jgi:hypothetical protein
MTKYLPIQVEITSETRKLRVTVEDLDHSLCLAVSFRARLNRNQIR